MHEVQRHILKKLSTAKGARYADLKPKWVEGNLFAYHLRTLMKEKLVAQSDKRYKLTLAGKRHVDRFSFETFTERTQPKIVTIIALEHNGRHLLYRRKRTPFQGLIGFPYGKIHLEERLGDAARRELKEKTGLTAKLEHRGDVYLTVHDETELVAHMLCHVFSGKDPGGVLERDSYIGECFWESLEKVPARERMPGVSQIAKLLKKEKGFFFAEYFLNATEN